MLYSVLVILFLISILSKTTTSLTSTSNVTVFPLYVTVIICTPTVFLSYPVTVYSETSNSFLLPLLNTSSITSPVKSNSSPLLYSVLVILFLISIPVVYLLLTLYSKLPVIP